MPALLQFHQGICIVILRSLFRVAATSALLSLLATGVSSAQDASKADLSGKPQAGQTPPPPAGLGPRAAAPGSAAPAGEPQPPPVETVAAFNGWQVQCSDIPVAAGQKPVKACGMTRSLKSDSDQSAAMTLIVRRSKAEDGKLHTLMEAWTPVGVYLPTGVAMEIDGTAIAGRMPFVRCAPRVCQAQGEAQEDTLKKFSKGKQATFYIYDRPGHGFPMKFPLQGFAEGMAALDKVAAK